MFGVKAMYVFGSTKNATAGPASDINLLVHFKGTDVQRLLLENWFNGWSQCLSEINQLKTGFKTDRMLDVHFITDNDIEAKSSYAVKIGAITDAARELPLMKKK
jgi:predicted nucleotidyltransferase